MSEAVSIIQSKKDPNTLVIICGQDYMTNFSYYYNRNYFSAIADGREYAEMEKLLQAENIYAEYSIPGSFNRIKYTKVIYYGIGNFFNRDQNPTLTYLKSQYRLAETKPVKLSGQLYFFEKSN